MAELPNPVKALYYPYINFRSLDWLKSALLYWEGVKRIVPYGGFPTDDPPEVQILTQEGLVDDVAANRFANQLGPYLGPDVFTRLRKVHGEIPLFSADWDEDDRETFIHVEKMTESIRETFTAGGLAERHEDWLRINRRMAGFYMTVLGNVIARKLNSPLVTDSPMHDLVGIALESTPRIRPLIPDGQVLARISCPFPSPESLANVSMETILDLRSKWSLQRREFRDYMQTFAAKVQAVSEPDAVRDLISDEQSRLKLHLLEQEEQLHEVGVKTLLGALNVTVPTSLAWLAQKAGFSPQHTVLAAGFGVAIGAVNWYGQYRADRRKARSSPVHYLISLKNDLEFPDTFYHTQSRG